MRRPIRGVVTMDQLVVEVTDGPPVAVGDEVVLVGHQGDDVITAGLGRPARHHRVRGRLRLRPPPAPDATAAGVVG